MKSTTAYYLILLYAVAVCKPFLPLVNDFLAHHFWNAAHIETVHHSHGASHVHNELKAAAKEEDKKATGNLVSEPVAVHVAALNNYNFTCVAHAAQQSSAISCAIPHAFLEKHTPPPKV